MDFQTVKSLAFTFAPFLISYGLSYYRSLKAQTESTRRIRQPLPTHIRHAISLLLVAATVSFLIGLPFFAPDNVFQLASSRLQTPSGVLWQRVAKTRFEGKLSPLDELLSPRLNSTRVRLLYLKYGPATIAECDFCHMDDQMTYLIYAMPAILFPHLCNIAVVAISTSNFLSGKEGRRWRTQAVLGGSIFAVLDVAAYYNFDQTKNGLALRGEDLTAFYWIMRAVRFIGIAAFNISLSTLLWATSTNRIFVAPVTSGEKVEGIMRQLQLVSGKVSAANILRNAAVRDEELQRTQAAFWKNENDFTETLMADEEVRRSMITAVNSGALDLRRVEHDAGQYAEGLINTIKNET